MKIPTEQQVTTAAAEQKRQSDLFHAKKQTETFHRKETQLYMQKGNIPFMFFGPLITDKPFHLFCICAGDVP